MVAIRRGTAPDARCLADRGFLRASGTSTATNLPLLPRMADFALWATAAEPALGFAAGQFMAAYQANRRPATKWRSRPHRSVRP